MIGGIAVNPAGGASAALLMDHSIVPARRAHGGLRSRIATQLQSARRKRRRAQKSCAQTRYFGKKTYGRQLPLPTCPPRSTQGRRSVRLMTSCESRRGAARYSGCTISLSSPARNRVRSSGLTRILAHDPGSPGSAMGESSGQVPLTGAVRSTTRTVLLNWS